MNGSAPVNDDVTQFIHNSGFPPLVVFFGALVLYAAGWGLFALRIGNLRGLLNPLRADQTPLPIWKRLLTVGVVITVGAGVLVLFLGSLAKDPTLPPEGYILAARISLSDRDYQSETVHRFTAQSGQLVGVFLRMKNINTPYIDVTLAGPAGQSYSLLHGEGFSAEFSIQQGNYGLPAGEARIVLTSQASPGLLEIYLLQP